jgi:hypothetical protein
MWLQLYPQSVSGFSSFSCCYPRRVLLPFADDLAEVATLSRSPKVPRPAIVQLRAGPVNRRRFARLTNTFSKAVQNHARSKPITKPSRRRGGRGPEGAGRDLPYQPVYQMIPSAITAFRSTGATAIIPAWLSYLARAHAELGQLDDARRNHPHGARDMLPSKRNFFGGTCVNTGCTPTKTLVASAAVRHCAQQVRHAEVPDG